MNPFRVGLVFAIAGCTSGIPADLPLVTPPVRAAAPPGFGATVLHADLRPAARIVSAAGGISAMEFRDRFFNPAGGPTDVIRILGDVDARLAEINTSSGESPRPCLDAPPVEYTLAPFGQSIPFVAQCARTFEGGSGPPAFMQFGTRDRTTYLYVTGGATRVAARITDGDTADAIVDVWYGVGYTNATCGTDGTFDGCSYAVTQIHASPATHAFEMSVAGIGVGFCGIQISSDGSAMFGDGSNDMGMTCGDAATLCVSADDLSAPGSCDAITTFVLPALGRNAGAGAHAFGASRYPEVPNITLDGTSTDSLQFGPSTAPTGGVGSYD